MRHPRKIGRLGPLALAAGVALALASVAAATDNRHAVAATVTVTVTDSSLRATPASPSAGATTFVVVNKGKKAHALMVKGPGVKGVRTAKLAAGHSAKLTVTLRTGAYSLSDPLNPAAYNVFFLDVVPAATLTAGGGDSVTTPTPQLPAMCGTGYTP